MTRGEAEAVKGLIRMLPLVGDRNNSVREISERQLRDFCAAVDAMVEEKQDDQRE